MRAPPTCSGSAALLAPLLVIALPSTPIFGGTKHWFTAYPFLCAVRRLRGAARDRVRRVAADQPRPGASPGAARSWPMARAARAGLRRDRAQPSVRPLALHARRRRRAGRGRPRHEPPVLGLHHRQRGRLPRTRSCPTAAACTSATRPYTAFDMLKRDGLLAGQHPCRRPTSPRPTTCSCTTSTTSPRSTSRSGRRSAATQPVHVLTYDGVPIISVYENPRRRSR